VCITELTLIHKNIRSVRNWHSQVYRSIWRKTHYDVTYKNNHVSFEGLARHYHKYPSSSYWTHWDTAFDGIVIIRQILLYTLYNVFWSNLESIKKIILEYLILIIHIISYSMMMRLISTLQVKFYKSIEINFLFIFKVKSSFQQSLKKNWELITTINKESNLY
jgi:hypothetical protein